MTKKPLTLNSVLAAATFGICCLFVVLCAAHFWRGRPLWLDEQSVFKSVVAFHPQDFFTKKLQVDQIFPRLYLFCIQIISRPFDFSVWSVRFFSFVAMVLAFFVWLRIARQEFTDRLPYFIFCLCWSASIPLVYYAAELKQYSMDVLAAGVFVLFLYQQKHWEENMSQRRYLALLMALPLFGLFSYPAFLFFIFPVYNLLMQKEKDRWHWIWISGYCLSALVVTLLFYFFDMRIASANATTQGYLDYMVSFSSFGEFFKTFGEGTLNLFSRWFCEQPRWIKKVSIFFLTPGMLFMVYGFYKTLKERCRTIQSVDALGLLLFAELFVLGVFHKYPFSVPRTSLFFCPVVFMLTIKGMGMLQGWNRNAYRILAGSFIVFLLFVATGITKVVLSSPLGAIAKIW